MPGAAHLLNTDAKVRKVFYIANDLSKTLRLFNVISPAIFFSSIFLSLQLIASSHLLITGASVCS
jgi:hypothetical protein